MNAPTATVDGANDWKKNGWRMFVTIAKPSNVCFDYVHYNNKYNGHIGYIEWAAGTHLKWILENWMRNPFFSAIFIY